MELKNKVAELVHNKIIEGISDYHTDLKDGVKITITLKKDANAQVVLNNLYKHTNFQVNYGIIFLVIDNGTPKTLPLKDIIAKYIDHQKEVIIREERVHILEGEKIALDNIDEVVHIIRSSKSDEEAQKRLIERFGLDEIQAQHILDMSLRKLTGLSREAVENELAELAIKIKDYNDILGSEARVLGIIKQEMIEIRDKYGDERRTDIDMTAIDYIEDESLIPVENIIISLTNKGYVKRIKTDTYKTQHRGGVGIKGMTTNEEDFAEQLINAKTHDYILFFSNRGRVYRIKGYEIPEFSRQSKGLPIINLLPLEKEEKIRSVVVVDPNDSTYNYLVFATKNGLVKRTRIEEFDNIRTSGKIAILLKEEDELVKVDKTTGDNEIIICSSAGRAVRFNEQEIRSMGRNTSGVKGIDITEAEVVGCEVITDKDNQQILIITKLGYGKKTNVTEFRLTHRGSKGVKALNVTEKNGQLVSIRTVHGDEDLMVVTDKGVIIRLSLDNISTLKRATQGVRLIRLKDDQSVGSVAIVQKEDDEEISEEDNAESSDADMSNNDQQVYNVQPEESNVTEE